MLSVRNLFILVLLTVVRPSYCQDTGTGFSSLSDSTIKTDFDETRFNLLADSLKGEKESYVVIGLKSEYRDYVDSAIISVSRQNNLVSPIEIGSGIYILSINLVSQMQPINISVSHPDYYTFDTALIISNSSDRFIFQLKPKYKISLRGRIYSGNIPLEDVDVQIIHKHDTFQLISRECFYDAEDYWNCLYHGMFKQDITTENPEDSIYIFITKKGYQESATAFKFNEYYGQVLPLRMQYSDYLPQLYRNNLALKFTFPVFSESNWFAGFSYLYTLKLQNFNRLALGAEGSILIKNHTEEFETFDGAETAVVDTSYLLAFSGPTCVLWVTNPQIRNYSLYLGSTYSYLFNTKVFGIQPFIGGRFYVDLNKAISFDVRYLNYDLDIVKYEFNPYGNATRRIEKMSFNNKIMISLGLHIGF